MGDCMTWTIIDLNCPFCLNAVLVSQTNYDDQIRYTHPVYYEVKIYKTLFVCGGCNKTIATSYKLVLDLWEEATKEQIKQIERRHEI